MANYFLFLDKRIQKLLLVVVKLSIAMPAAPPVYKNLSYDYWATAANKVNFFISLTLEFYDSFIFLIRPSHRSYLLASSIRKTKFSKYGASLDSLG